MMWMDVDTALSEVPVNTVPLTDDTDFKSIEESVAYNATGMELIWHFTTTAGATSATVVTPTTGGAYDWAHQDGGMYTIEIPASGGASANNDTEGFGYFTGKATGVLPWRGPTIGFRAAALNNAYIDGGDLPDVNVTHIADTAQTGRDIGASVLLSPGTGTGQISLSSGTVTIGTNNDKTGYTASTVSDKTGYSLAADQAVNTTKFAGQTITCGAGVTIHPVVGQDYKVLVNASGHVSRVVLCDTTTANTDMRGTDGANTTVPDAAGVVEGLLGTLETHGDSTWATATGFSTHDAAAVVTALGTGSTLTDCLTASGFSTHSAADVVTALGTGSTLTACLTATGFSTHDAAAVWAVASRTLTAFGFSVALADDAITAAKFDESTAFPLKSADTGATAVARTGADADTLETLSDQIDGVGGGGDATEAKQDTIIAAVAAVKTDTGNLVTRITSTLFSGITYMKNWLACIMGKTADTTTRTEINLTTAAAAYNETTDSQEAIRDQGDSAWASSVAGTGSFAVNHNSPTANALAALTGGGAGISGITVWAFLTSDYTAGNQSSGYRKGTTTTNDAGGWIDSLMLNAGAYTIRYEDPTGTYATNTKTITVGSTGTVTVTS